MERGSVRMTTGTVVISVEGEMGISKTDLKKPTKVTRIEIDCL
jgi:hypothetical protein